MCAKRNLINFFGANFIILCLSPMTNVCQPAALCIGPGPCVATRDAWAGSGRNRNGPGRTIFFGLMSRPELTLTNVVRDHFQIFISKRNITSFAWSQVAKELPRQRQLQLTFSSQRQMPLVVCFHQMVPLVSFAQSGLIIVSYFSYTFLCMQSNNVYTNLFLYKPENSGG
jgi:hypothetical protein